MMPRTPTSALSAWTPLVNVRPLFSASAGIVTTPTAERSWRKQALKGVVTDVRGRHWPLGCNMGKRNYCFKANGGAYTSSFPPNKSRDAILSVAYRY